MKNITETKITSTTRNYSSGNRLRNCNGNKCVIFVNSTLSDIIDDWFNTNQIYNMDVKSKAWDSLRRACVRIEAEIIREYFKMSTGDLAITWSSKAGCSCPCSPGLVVTINNNHGSFPYINHWIWMDIAGTSEYLARIHAAIAKANKILNGEKIVETSCTTPVVNTPEVILDFTI